MDWHDFEPEAPSPGPALSRREFDKDFAAWGMQAVLGSQAEQHYSDMREEERVRCRQMAE